MNANLIEIEKNFNELTQDVDNLKTKPWLSTAIISHLERWVPHSNRNEITQFVRNYFGTQFS